MKARSAAVLATALLLMPVSAAAQDDGPRFCPNNPSLESSACTTEPGRVHLEVTGIDWELDRQPGERTDRFAFANLLVRTGVGRATEVQVEWSPYGRVRERDDQGVASRRGAGDVTLAVRHAFAGADGKALSIGIQPFVTLPVGRTPVGAGTWGAGAILPVTYDLTDTVTIGTTAELDATPDEDGHGRHVAGNLVAGATYDLTDSLSATLEAEWQRDDDPMGATTQWTAGTGLLWTIAPRRALYAEAVAGLNHDAPDVRLYAGMAVLF